VGIKIFLRKTGKQNCFRAVATEFPKVATVDELILCSGFFQEDRWGYFASLENDFSSTLHNNNVKVTTYGIHNSQWTTSYINFVNNLRSAGVNVNAKRKASMRWHAKILIYKYKGAPIVGIIGSSNITRPAFAITPPFNYESDVLLYIPAVEQQVETLLKEANNEDVINAQYDVEENHGLSIEERLRNLEKDITSDKWETVEL